MTTPITYMAADAAYVFPCPHCAQMVQVLKAETACRIFRHGVYKATNTQMPPHTAKPECDRLAAEGLLYGCGKPFRLTRGREPHVEICGYI